MCVCEGRGGEDYLSAVFVCTICLCLSACVCERVVMHIHTLFIYRKIGHFAKQTKRIPTCEQFVFYIKEFNIHATYEIYLRCKLHLTRGKKIEISSFKYEPERCIRPSKNNLEHILPHSIQSISERTKKRK